MNAMNYLFAAYMAVWIVLAVYLFSIHSREKKLRGDIRRLEQALLNLKENPGRDKPE